MSDDRFTAWRLYQEESSDRAYPDPDALEWSLLNRAVHLEADGCVCEEPKPRRSVALIGASYSQRVAPLESDEWDVWTLNNIAPVTPTGTIRADRWFEIHEPRVRSEARWARLCQLPRPVVACHTQGLRYPIRFPREAILKAGYRDYFANSFAYQIALALFEGYRRIGLFGLSLATGSPRERTVEAACVSYWTGLAEGQGVELVIPPSAWGLLQHPCPYGDEDERLHVAMYTVAMDLASQQYLASGYPVAHGMRLSDIAGR